MSRPGISPAPSGYSPEATAATPASGTPLPLADLGLWLKSDSGTRARGGSLDFWQDQSGRGHSVVQPAAAAQPQLISDGLGSRPTLRFDGAAQYLDVPAFMSARTQAEAFVVLRVATARLTTDGSVWGLGQSPDHGARYPTSQGQLQDDFASTATYFLESVSTLLDQFHLYNVASQQDCWMAWINGALAAERAGNTYAAPDNPTLGASLQGTPSYFGGDIAEVMIFDRVLTTEERDSVGGYLSQRYGLASSTPAAPARVQAQALSASQIAVTWTPAGASRYLVERKIGAAGAYAQIAAVRDAGTFMDAGLTPQTQYFYRVRAVSFAGASDYSAEASATTAADGGTLPAGGLVLWLKADVRDWANGAAVSEWPDLSDGRNHALQAVAARRPTFVADALNAKPALHFDGVDDYLSLPNLLRDNPQAELFVVLKATSATPSSDRGGLRFGPSGSHYPNADGTVSDDFGTAQAHTLPAALPPVDQFHLHNVQASDADWVGRRNGTVLLSAGNDAFKAGSSPAIGLSDSAFAGDIAEVLLFNRELTAAERTVVERYLNQRYALVAAPPAAPVVSLTVPSASAITLSWNANLANASEFIVERAAGVGAFCVIAMLPSRGVTGFTDSNLSAGLAFRYRVRANSLAGFSEYSNIVQRPLDPAGMPDFIESLYDPLSGQVGDNSNVRLRLYSPLPR